MNLKALLDNTEPRDWPALIEDIATSSGGDKDLRLAAVEHPDCPVSALLAVHNEDPVGFLGRHAGALYSWRVLGPALQRADRPMPVDDYMAAERRRDLDCGGLDL